MKHNEAFWPSYVDIMTTLFAIMLILFAVSYVKHKAAEEELKKTEAKYIEIKNIYSNIEKIDSTFFEFNQQYVKHIFKLKVKYAKGEFSIENGLEDTVNAESLRQKIIQVGKIVKATLDTMRQDTNMKQDFKYLVVIEGQASADGYRTDDWKNNDVLSYQRALALHRFWKANGLDFSTMERCELLISGSGEGGVPRAKIEDDNQRFLIHIVPVINNTDRNGNGK